MPRPSRSCRESAGFVTQVCPARQMLDALQSAMLRRRPLSGLVVHSDHGRQHTSDAFRNALSWLGFRRSMGGNRDRRDIAFARSLFAHCPRKAWKAFSDSAEDPLEDLFSCLDDWYNSARPHSALAIRSPLRFERGFASVQASQHGRVAPNIGVARCFPSPQRNPALQHLSERKGTPVSVKTDHLQMSPAQRCTVPRGNRTPGHLRTNSPCMTGPRRPDPITRAPQSSAAAMDFEERTFRNQAGTCWQPEKVRPDIA